MMIICPNCRERIYENADTCPYCGSLLKTQAERSTPHQTGQRGIRCPNCDSSNVFIQREQTASIGVSQNSVTVEEPKVSHGCLWWLLIGWWWKMLYWMCIGWWWYPLFGRKRKKGHNFNAKKNIYRTVAVCQRCGHSWEV